jgi:TPR repeat protein
MFVNISVHVTIELYLLSDEKSRHENQGIQIFLGTIYQNGKNIPNDHKMAIKFGHKIWP